MIYHLYSAYDPSDPDTQMRQFVAKMTWSTQPWKELPVSDQQLPRLWREEGRQYPYLKDLFDFACQQLHPADILVFTNADICVCSMCAFLVGGFLQETNAAYCYRRDFNHHFTEPIPDAMIPSADSYVGSDLYAFRVDWWRRSRENFPDMLIGHELNDPVLRELIGRTNPGKQTVMKDLIYHRRHASWWEKNENRYRLKGQLYNLNLGCQWLRKLGLDPRSYGVPPGY